MPDADASKQLFRLRVEILRAGESPILHSYTLEEYCL
jgi:hypothetical protein